MSKREDNIWLKVWLPIILSLSLFPLINSNDTFKVAAWRL